MYVLCPRRDILLQTSRALWRHPPQSFLMSFRKKAERTSAKIIQLSTYLISGSEEGLSIYPSSWLPLYNEHPPFYKDSCESPFHRKQPFDYIIFLF